jgi:hypothetical protein
VLVFKVTAQDLLVAETVLPSKRDQAEFLSLADNYGVQPRILPVERK